LVLIALAFASCGSTKKAATTPATGSSGPQVPPVKSVIYRVRLASTNEAPAGAPKGSGLAVISIDASTDELCWAFSQLKNVLAPTEATINGHPRFGYTHTPLFPYTANGCTQEPALLLYLFEHTPQRYYVNIQNRHHPGRAVRGRL
jgi:hypothetical protein